MSRAERVGIRELRKNLRAHLTSGKTVAIGGPYELRAFLVAVPQHSSYSATEKKKALAEAKRNLRAAIDAEQQE